MSDAASAAPGRVLIVLPAASPVPIGGYKVHYQLANALAARGSAVRIAHLFSNEEALPALALGVLAYDRWRRPPAGTLAPWFAFHDNVVSLRIPRAWPRLLPAADLTLFTAWETSQYVAGPTRRHPRLAQVVYDYEHWVAAAPEQRRRMATALTQPGVRRVATSTSVTRMLEQLGSDWATIVPPGVCLSGLHADAPIAGRPHRVLMPLRRDPTKGADIALAAAEVIRAQRPDVELVAFGTGLPGGGPVPAWLSMRGVVDDPDLARLYASSQVFLFPSIAEGWGLPALEAMASGCAAVIADNGGSADYAEHDANALVVPSGSAAALAAAVLRLLAEQPLRYRIAQQGRTTALALDARGCVARLVEALEP